MRGSIFFDTANVYGGKEQNGRTEEIIGRWFQQGGGRREKVVLATKVYGDMNDASDGPNAERGLSAYKIRRHLEASLKRLQTDHIELYQMHHVDRNVSWDELWGAFESMVNQQSRLYRSSNFAGWHIAVAQAEAKARHFLGLVSEQHLYNLTARLPELEVLPAAEKNSALASFRGVRWREAARPQRLAGSGARSARSAERIEKHRSQLERFAGVCKEIGEKEDVVAWHGYSPIRPSLRRSSDRERSSSCRIRSAYRKSRLAKIR